MDQMCELEILKAAAEGFSKESASKLASAVGCIFPFWGVKRAAVEAYITGIQDSNLSPEEKMLAIANVKKAYKQAANQAKIAKIAQDSAKEGTDFSMKSQVNDEWLERFMDSARFVSDEQAQYLWGNILASEFEKPGSTPPSVTRVLSEVTQAYAKAFQVICSLEVEIEAYDAQGQVRENYKQIVLPDSYDYLSDQRINYSVINELDELGLIIVNPLGVVIKFQTKERPRIRLKYGDNVEEVLNYMDLNFPIGKVVLSKAGETISKFTERNIIPFHLANVCEYMKKYGVKFNHA